MNLVQRAGEVEKAEDPELSQKRTSETGGRDSSQKVEGKTPNQERDRTENITIHRVSSPHNTLRDPPNHHSKLW